VCSLEWLRDRVPGCMLTATANRCSMQALLTRKECCARLALPAVRATRSHPSACFCVVMLHTGAADCAHEMVPIGGLVCKERPGGTVAVCMCERPGARGNSCTLTPNLILECGAAERPAWHPLRPPSPPSVHTA
jgi:hypothetical protein